MRWAPLPWALPHAATRASEYRGVSFKEGDLAFVLVPAANRDPNVVEEPNAFNITRDRAKHFAFGGGMHSCPGAQLARMEMSSALASLVERLDVIELVEAEWEVGNVGRTLKSLRLRIRKG